MLLDGVVKEALAVQAGVEVGQTEFAAAAVTAP